MSRKFPSPFGTVELTDERWRHIVQFHPDLERLATQIASVLDDPDEIRRSKFDPKVLLCYRKYDQKHLAVVVKTNERHFVLTAYLTKRIQHRSL